MIKKHMFKASKLLLFVSIIALTCFSCNVDPNKVPSDAKITEGGVRYKIFDENEQAQQLKVGDIIEYNILLTHGDSIIQKSTESMKLFEVRKGDFREPLLNCHVGDSASVWMSVDTLKKRMVPTGNLPLGTDLKYTFKINKILPKEFGEVIGIEEEEQIQEDAVEGEEIEEFPVEEEQIEEEAVDHSKENQAIVSDSL